MAGIRRADAARLLTAVECQRIDAEILAPKVRFESLSQSLGLLFELPRPSCKTDVLREPSGAALCRVNVALYLAERDRAFGERAIRVEHGVLRILPTLL